MDKQSWDNLIDHIRQLGQWIISNDRSILKIEKDILQLIDENNDLKARINTLEREVYDDD